MPSIRSVESLDILPRLGLVTVPSPVESLPELATRLGLASLTVKRDDLIPALGGGNKARKLDCLLAQPPFATADVWQSVGGIGSGHLVALAQAALALDRRLIAHCFDQALSPHVEANLALITAGRTELHYYRSRLGLALCRPSLFLGPQNAAMPVIAPGATTPAGMVGFVRAGLELGAQIRAGDLPEPHVIYVPLGTGGTVTGLAVGLGMAGIRCRLHAVAVVERLFVSRRRLCALQEQLLAWMEARGIAGIRQMGQAPVIIERRQVGDGYGSVTPAATEACSLLAEQGMPLETVYTGKAMAALLHDAPGLSRKNALFWMTARGQTLQAEKGWRQHLPEPLARRLGSGAGSLPMTRRHFLLAATLTAGVAASGCRDDGRTAAAPDWQGRVLSGQQALVLAAAAEVLLPRLAGAPEPLTVARNIDRYLVALTGAQQQQVHLLLLVIEHGTLLGGHLSRFTRLDPEARLSFLTALQAGGTLMAQAYRGLRDLCLLGYYQEPVTWGRLGYDGPWVVVSGGQAVSSARYEALRAPPGRLPAGARA
jgi:D-cysteine desulfhydrase